jgi:DNA polymerase III epsilon subunit-like protein
MTMCEAAGPGTATGHSGFLSAPGAHAARPLVFLDFEASALSPASWPVEIGLAWLAGGRVRSRSHVIAPRPGWRRSEWCARAARVHGISLDEVLRGTPAAKVAALTDRLIGCDVVSDNPLWDQRWLDRLRGEGAPRVVVTGLRDAMLRRLDDTAASALQLALLRSAPPHRAGPDAERLARAWAAATMGAPRVA